MLHATWFSQIKPQHLYFRAHLSLRSPENLKTCLSASTGENVGYVHLTFLYSLSSILPQKAKPQAFSTILRLRWTNTQPLAHSQGNFSSVQCGLHQVGTLTAGPSQLSFLSCNSIHTASAFTQTLFAAIQRVFLICLGFLEFSEYPGVTSCRRNVGS